MRVKKEVQKTYAKGYVKGETKSKQTRKGSSSQGKQSRIKNRKWEVEWHIKNNDVYRGD